ncbi:MAG: protein phosphatase 2C domain-containing protein [Planctomycetia bacterium]|nr:protein phosphatase 2C domain-containing protein [Planctomycetia bacterium]
MKSHENIWKNCLEYCTISNLGLRRSNNQDAHAEILARDQFQWNQRGHLFIVADGMGAHASGELASKLATDLIPLSYFKKTAVPPAESLRTSIEEANHQIHIRGNADSGHRGMGTTCDALLILPEGAVIGHVGDSRVYRLRGTRFEQMTFDHSLLWEAQASGKKPDGTIQKNIITRCLGVNPTVQVALEGPWELLPGDIYLLCSDGLSGQFENHDDEMGKILHSLPLPEATQVLVDLANLRGGPDNITITTVKYLGTQKMEKETPAELSPKNTHSPTQKNHNLKQEETVTSTIIDPSPIPVWAWTTLGILGSFTILLFLFSFQNIFIGIGALLLLLITLIFIVLMLNMRRAPEAFSLRPLGKGPYRVFSAACDEKITEVLYEIYKELRTSVGNQHTLKLSEADHFAHLGKTATTNRHYTEGCAAFCRAISSIWAQLENR